MVANAGPMSGPGWTGHSPDGPGRGGCPLRKARQDSDREGFHSESLPAQQPEQHWQWHQLASTVTAGILRDYPGTHTGPGSHLCQQQLHPPASQSRSPRWLRSGRVLGRCSCARPRRRAHTARLGRTLPYADSSTTKEPSSSDSEWKFPSQLDFPVHEAGSLSEAPWPADCGTVHPDAPGGPEGKVLEFLIVSDSHSDSESLTSVLNQPEGYQGVSGSTRNQDQGRGYRGVRPHWVPRVPQGYQGYQESRSGMGV